MPDSAPSELVLVRPAVCGDAAEVWRILEPVLRAGETYALPSDWDFSEALAYWFGPLHTVFVAETAGRVLGTYYLQANQPGGGSHVANCGFVTLQEGRRRGVARQMCLHALDAAARQGFLAMQFNFVVSTNEGAIRLWTSLGFEVVGRLPEAFRHPTAGLIDALVMSRRL